MGNRAKVSFDVTADDYDLIHKIVKRARALGKEMGVSVNALDLEMDLTACHANGAPLRLAELLETDNGNFGHDVFGINRYIDRSTGELTDCFRPRFAVPSKSGKPI